MKNKAFVSAFIVLLSFAAGCASSGIKKPTVFVDRYNSIPADIPSQFMDRYYFLVDKERKEFEKLVTDEERQEFVNKFWLERDTDPATPENEYKHEIDKRIDNIANEPFLSTPGVFGLSFRRNGGFYGNMARIYLLHGEPYAVDTIEGNLFVPLMLWVYVNPENGRIRYAFLFYQKGGSGAFTLFSQDVYKFDLCGAVNEIRVFKDYTHFNSGNQDCLSNAQQVLRELQTASSKVGILDGYIFAWALFNFSQDSSISQGAALNPPKPASEIAKQSKARVVGEASKPTGVAGTDYILASCETCNSMIPAEFSAGERFTLSGSWKNFDWTVKGEYLELSLKYRIIFENHNTNQLVVLEDIVKKRVKKNFLEEYPELVVTVDLLEPAQVAAIPSGTYQVSVYIKNLMTKKNNAWAKKLVK